MKHEKTNVTWYLENRIILAHSVGDNTIEDFQVIDKMITHYLDQGIAPVHLLIDITELVNIPSNVRQVKQAFTYLEHPSLGWNIFIGQMNVIKKFVVSVTTQLSGVDAKTVDTLDEALMVLNQIDLTLNDAAN